MTNIPNLDLHNVKHEDVITIVEDWTLLWSYRVPAFAGKIITGNSTKMKTIVEGVLRKHSFEYKHMSDGSILVSGKI
jgi:hypothetical protein